MKARTSSLLHTMGTILKYLASAILVLVAFGALGLVVIVRLGGPAVMAMLALLGVWCIGSVWFLHFRKGVSTTTRRWIALTLAVFPVCFCFAWMNLWRLEQYLRHRDWLTYKSEHFVFHYAPNDPRSQEIAAFAGIRDKAFAQNCAYLKVSLEGKTDFYVYEKLDEGFAVPDWNVIHADDDQSIGHEMTHIIAYHIAGHRQKIKLLDEGIATWLNHSTVVKDHHRVAWEYIQTNGLPPLNELAHTRAFRRHRPPPYYPAASFVGYLVDNYGLDAFRKIWIANAWYPELYSNVEDLRLAKYFSFIPGERAQFESTVLQIYGRPLNELDTEWRAWLERRYRR
jgi:hypothetical protein